MTALAWIKREISLVLPRGRFARSVAVMAGGTALGQAITVLISPILTRLYTPEDFGLLATYTAYVTILSVIATGRYELIIPLIKSDHDAANLVMLTLKICAVMGLLLLPILVIVDNVIGILGGQTLGPWVYLLPVSIFAMGVFNTLQFWLNRAGKYEHMSIIRIQNAAFTSASSVFLGLRHIHGGLILGRLMGEIFASLWAWYQIRRKDSSVFTSTTWNNQRKMLRKHLSLIKHVVPAHLIGTVGMQIPILMISNVYSLEIAGFFSLAYRIVTLPSILIANAIGDVYRQRAARDFNLKGEFRDIYIKTLRATTLLAFPLYFLLFLTSPDIFALIFGKSWRVAGEYARILAIGAFFQFAFTPIDKGALIVGATRYIFLWHLTRFFLLLGLFVCTILCNIPVEIVLYTLVIINLTLYTIDGIMGFKFAKGGKF